MQALSSSFTQDREPPVLPAPSEGRSRPALRPMPTALGLAIALYAVFHETRIELATALEDQLPAAGLTGAAIAALATQTIGHAIEAAFYSLQWRMFRRRVGFGWMFCAVIWLSVLDALANATARAGADSSAPWLAPIVGLRAIPDLLRESPGVRTAFGSIGLLTVARVAGTAYAQRQEGVPWRGAFTLTFAVWIATRLATWWSADLLRGFSATN